MRQQMIARYPGRCYATGYAIRPGDLIEFDRGTRRAYLIDRAPTISAAAAMVRDMDPEIDPDTAESVGRYMASRPYQSDIYRASGREYYRNKRGRCDDAPCCGCCNF